MSDVIVLAYSMLSIIFHTVHHHSRFVLRNIGEQLTEDEIEELVKEADQDADGQISYDGKIVVYLVLNEGLFQRGIYIKSFKVI